ncbi:molecular chaperone TorD family protein [uncultured Enterovirga sp.]|uniref:molecular chaperone TorD family protein n=1 Tax=uncultured Enterovirga sp. TaxID=2026352 RepID=UPI0035CA8E39
MRGEALVEAVRAAGGFGVLARSLGISQLAVSSWRRVPSDRVLAVGALTKVPRSRLRPDLYPGEEPSLSEDAGTADGPVADDLDLFRSQHYGLLSVLLGRAPNADLLGPLAALRGDQSQLGRAHQALAAAARQCDPAAVSQEYFDLFVGVGRGELLPYASYYLTGFLNERPLARVREDMAALGIERADQVGEPEDHIAILLDTMASLASGRVAAEVGAESRFFARHIEPWAGKLFADLETAKAARFYSHVGALGRLFMDIETEAFAIEA